jgi:GH35 family endo-1,4-beta-xylanase
VEVHNLKNLLLSDEAVNNSDIIKGKVTRVRGEDFDQCLTINIKQPSESPYSVNLSLTHDQGWKVGQSGVIALVARTLFSENRLNVGSFLMQFKPNTKDWRGYYNKDVFISDQWSLVILPFKVGIDSESTLLNFFFGGVDPQVVQFAELQILRYEDDKELHDLPRTDVYYPGIEIDAPWRIAAKKRIENIRKADFKLNFKDQKGKPLKGLKVKAELKKHAFGFGSAVQASAISNPKIPKAKRDQYKKMVLDHFNRVTIENALKWRLYDNMKQFVKPTVDWALANDLDLRGHLFVWPGFARLPDDYNVYKTDPDQFRKDIIDRIHYKANLYPDAFFEWDVMNEPHTEHEFMDLLGKDVVLDWFKAAREANGKYANVINDYGILTGNDLAHQNKYFEWIKYLTDNKAELDSIGFQGHYRTAVPPEEIWDRLERFSEFGLDMQITEYDFDHPDEDLQAQFTHDFMTVAFSHPQVNSIVTWTPMENHHRPYAAFFKKDFSIRPVGEVWKNLTQKTWSTKVKKYLKKGDLSFRGFKGKYLIQADYKGKSKTWEIDLKDDTSLDLTW